MASVLCVGHAVQDFVFGMPQLPLAARKYRASSFHATGGGPAATAAVAIARLGGRALLAARLGDDLLAGLITAELAGYGVDCTHLRRLPGRASSVSAVIVDDAGERLVANHVDPGMPAGAEWLPDPAALGVGAVLADTRWPEGALAALAAARAAGLPAVLDADGGLPEDGELLRVATHVAFSAEGLTELAGLDAVVPALEAIAPRVPGWCCVTVGGEGVLALAGGRLRRHPAFEVEVRDTLGAGDVWHGAFALALAEGRGEDEAVRFASAAAALKVQRPGGRAGAPLRADVEEFLATHPAVAATNPGGG